MESTQILLNNNFFEMIREFKPKKSPRWLPKTYSAAFAVCLGAGPWRFNRRRHIQGLALSHIGPKDLRYLNPDKCDFFPLKWQNDILKNMVIFLRENDISFKDLCLEAKNKNNISIIYRACGKNSHIKTISLFCRDKLKIDSFPIDRHVAKNLKKYGMPIKEDLMINLCRKNNLNPILVSYGLVAKNLDRGNPDWSKYGRATRNGSS